MRYTREGIAKDKTGLFKVAGGGLAAFSIAGVMLASAFAASTVTVLPGNTSWTSTDTRTNGQVNFVEDAMSPYPNGALQLKTGDSTASPSQDKANYATSFTAPLSAVTEMSYYTKQVAASFAAGDASYQLSTCLYGVTATDCAPSPNGTSPNWTNLVFEPYVSAGNDVVKAGEWQKWDVAAGHLWSTKDIGAGTMMSGYNTFTLSELKNKFPNAVVVGLALNVGSSNPNYDIYVDGVNFNGTTFDFQKVAPDTQAPSVPTKLRWQNPNVACNGYTNSYNIKAAWDAATDNTGVAGYEYSVMTPQRTTWGAAWTTNVGTATTYGGAFTEGTGTYTFRVRAYDAAGNYSDWSSPCAVTYDTTAPDVTITSPTNGSTVHGNVTLAANITDNTALMRYYYFVKGESGYVVGPVTVNTSDSLVNFSRTVDTTTWADGTYTFQVEARDAAGNKDAGSVAKVTFTVNNVIDTKEQCKDGGWKDFLKEDRTAFKNQGQCVAYVVSDDNSRLHR